MRIPVATYRFQFHKRFTFAQARALLPYLRDLGVSDVYASPIFLAGPESTHGYDICGFDRVNPNLGSAEEFAEFTTEIRELGMGLLVDMVPNHMGTHLSNCWWRDVLQHGANSKFSTYFDIQWHPANPLLQGKVLLPVLGGHYNAVLERGELKVIYENGAFHLAYFDKHYPLSPESEAAFNLGSLWDSKRAGFLAELNGRPGEPASFDRLHQLIELQHYRLAFWRVGPHEINYRRFFDVTELISVRVEDEDVFQATHKVLLELIQSGRVTGLRIDHPDGLRDPKTYFYRLHSEGKNYVLAEKILSDEERLPADWPIHGTTGYDYLNYLNGLFIRAESEPAFTDFYSRVTGATEDFATLAFRSKQEVLHRMFIAEVKALTARLKSLAVATRTGRDFTEADLRTAIIDFIAAFPVYRTYVNDWTEQLTPAEKRFIEDGLAEAKERTAALDSRALEFLAGILSLDFPIDFTDEIRAKAREFVVRFQQLSGPATAKGLEDTAFYRYTRFVSLNEVGGNPGRFGVRPEEFHTYNHHKQEQWPHSMLASSTHDTKRGEDTRARLNVLSEIPAEWEGLVLEWRAVNEPHKRNSAPSPSDELLLYQVLAGTWTLDADLSTYIERIQNYMLKATREAKVHTAWTEPNDAYERSTSEFIAAILKSPRFVGSLSSFVEELAYFGMFNSIAQVILKACSPGVPDFYQGTELWDLTLVDPDNRRPIDYSLRQKVLAEIREKRPTALLENWQSGAIKMHATTKALRARHEHAALRSGDYHPVRVVGPKADHIIAFARTSGDSTILVAVPRFLRTLTKGAREYPSAEDWAGTRLEHPGKRFRNLMTNEEISSIEAADLFRNFPGAILEVT